MSGIKYYITNNIWKLINSTPPLHSLASLPIHTNRPITKQRWWSVSEIVYHNPLCLVWKIPVLGSSCLLWRTFGFSSLKKKKKNGPGFSSSSLTPAPKKKGTSGLILVWFLKIKKIQVSISILVLKIRPSYLEPNFQNQKIEKRKKKKKKNPSFNLRPLIFSN